MKNKNTINLGVRLKIPGKHSRFITGLEKVFKKEKKEGEGMIGKLTLSTVAILIFSISICLFPQETATALLSKKPVPLTGFIVIRQFLEERN